MKKLVSNYKSKLYPGGDMGSVSGIFLHDEHRVNEDSVASYYDETGNRIMVVCDGIGGEDSGEIWSQNLVGFLYANRQRISDKLREIPKVTTSLNAYFEAILSDFECEMAPMYPNSEGGCTVTYCHEIAPNVFVSFLIGDSPLFLVSENNNLIQSQFELDSFDLYSGRITNCVRRANNMLYQDVKIVELTTHGTSLLACTDGITDNLSGQAILSCKGDYTQLTESLKFLAVNPEQSDIVYFADFALHHGLMKPDDFGYAFIKWKLPMNYLQVNTFQNFVPKVDVGPFSEVVSFQLLHEVHNTLMACEQTKSMSSVQETNALQVNISGNEISQEAFDDFNDFAMSDIQDVKHVDTTESNDVTILLTDSEFDRNQGDYVCISASMVHYMCEVFDMDEDEVDFDQEYYLSKDKLEDVFFLFNNVSLDFYANVFNYELKELDLDSLPQGFYFNGKVYLDECIYRGIIQNNADQKREFIKTNIGDIITILIVSTGFYYSIKALIDNLK
ncbi:hypothetical protein HOJ01_03760 [bacterium]|jgi:PPM family protein phosphatase|nr:hypothetical protein [bacterium]